MKYVVQIEVITTEVDNEGKRKTLKTLRDEIVNKYAGCSLFKSVPIKTLKVSVKPTTYIHGAEEQT